jgi:hypothetical protein
MPETPYPRGKLKALILLAHIRLGFESYLEKHSSLFDQSICNEERKVGKLDLYVSILGNFFLSWCCPQKKATVFLYK